MDLTRQQADEIKLCKKDFIHFLRYLKIVNKKNLLVTLELNSAQKEILHNLTNNNLIKILKARQLGSSTFIAAYYFWKTLFKINERTVVIAHQHESVKSVYKIYKTFYDHLPSFLKNTFKTVQSSANSIEFVTGSSIKIGSANSEAFRGSSAICNLHLSEVAFWDNMNETIASIFQASSENPTIILETTANGLNDFYNFWTDDNGYEPIFLSWYSDENNRLKTLSDKHKKLLTSKNEIVTLLLENIIDDEQRNWAIETYFVKCAGDLAKFKQEYAPTAVDCFITSGDRFFNQTFIVEREAEIGYKQYCERQPGRIYSIGVDTASGSDKGDYSSFVVTDITNKDVPIICATYYGRVPIFEYCKLVHMECLKWDCFAVVEKNSYGLTIVEYLVGMQYTFMYTQTKWDVAENRYSDTYGFPTTMTTRPLLLSRLQSFINKNKIVIDDVRLQIEVNNFVYHNNKAQANKGSHDDMIFALGLSLMAMDQYDYIQQNRKIAQPQDRNDWYRLQTTMHMSKKQLIDEGFVSNEAKWTNTSPIQF